MRTLRVSLRFGPDEQREVGVLAEDGPRVWVELSSSFVAAGLEISPLRLPLIGPTLREHRVRPGVAVPGVFNDARPDGWGLKLLHRAFQSVGRAASSVSPLDELAYLGQHTMGALVFEPSSGPTGTFDDAVHLASLARHAQAVWDRTESVVSPELVRAGVPSGGARPKALIALRDDGGPGVRYGEGTLSAGWGAWLIKFPAGDDDDEVGRREAAWMAMARVAGLEVPQTRVIPIEGVGDAFAVRRFDRPSADTRLHMLSGAGALDVDFRTAAADYEHLLRATHAICAGDQIEVLRMFRLAAFNVAAVNDDDHLKNVAWTLDAGGRWRLSPSFDLTYAPRPRGERAVTVAGTSRAVGREALLAVAATGGIKASAARRILDDVALATQDVASVLRDHGCENPVSRAAIHAVLAATARLGP